MFAAGAEPAFESLSELEAHWGRGWGVGNDVGRIRAVLVHRPGAEMEVIDPTKRIESIGSFGDEKAGWYFQSDRVPEISEMQAQHDALVMALNAEGVEVCNVEGVGGGRLKSCYTRDPLIMVKGGAIVCRMGARIRRGEELAITRTLARLGIPILRTLSAAEMAQYRRPFAEPGEGRRPTLTWPRQIPIEGEPADVTAIAAAYADWLATSQVPKLFVKAEPGLLVAGGANIDFARRLPAQTEVTVAGLHFLQEDSPNEIGRAIAGWMKALD